jgi:hypothetical protein
MMSMSFIKTNKNNIKEYRKVQGLVGESSFSIVLPKSFAIALGIGKGEEKNDNTKTNADSPLNHSNSQQTNIDKETIGHSSVKTEANTIGSVKNNQTSIGTTVIE